MTEKSEPTLSILVCAYNMHRELPRTLRTLSRAYQIGADDVDWEVVVLDNGSDPPVDPVAIQAILPGVKVVRPDASKPSPVAAINRGMRDLKGQFLGLWIDGARLASPGIIRCAVDAWRAEPNRAIATLSFHLGSDVQMRAVAEGYDAATEDALLASVPWEKDGYRLFDISVLAGSSQEGWFGALSETNGLFIDRSLWDAVGGLDERFEAPGGGLANLDLWERLVEASDRRPWMILGEGTFHQVHGGAATNGPAESRTDMHSEYAELRGHGFKRPAYTPQFVGSLDSTSFRKGADHPVDRTRHVRSVRQRSFQVDLPTDALNRIQQGTLRTKYKGLRLAKSPFDLALYVQAIERLKPLGIIEIGSSEGGSAAWLIDQCRALGLADTRLVSIDIAPPPLHIPGVSFAYGDSYEPNESFPHELIDELPHPWLVIEDSAHTYESAKAVLDYFDGRMLSRDMFVLEDGVLADLEGEVYRRLEDGPNRALAEFLQRTDDRYTIETWLCDFYGHNITYAPNAWLRRS